MSATRPDALVEAFDRLASRAPAASLVLHAAARFTVEDVAALARRFTKAIRARRLEEGAALGLQAPNGAGFLAALLAGRRCGHPLVLLDAAATGAERERVAAGLGLAAWLRLERPDATAVELLVEAVPLRRAVQPPPPGTALIKLTSGSTGEPRGIAASAAALLADEEALRRTMGVRAGDRLLATVPFSHSYGLSSLVLPALVWGAPLVVAAAGDPFGSLRAAQRGEATVLFTAPAYLAALLRLREPPPLPPSLRRIVAAGAPLLPGTARRFRERLGHGVHVFYGASECGGITYDREGGAAERGTVGEPVQGVTVELETLPGLPPAEGARVVVRSAAVASDYWPRPDERLAAGRFASEDLALRRGSELALLGRLDDWINVRGRKVSPREVEGVIAGLEQVEEVVVHGTPNGWRGGAVQAVVAAREGALDVETILRWCRERLADYKVPRRVVLLPELPRTERGKLDRAAVVAALATR